MFINASSASWPPYQGTPGPYNVGGMKLRLKCEYCRHMTDVSKQKCETCGAPVRG